MLKKWSYVIGLALLFILTACGQQAGQTNGQAVVNQIEGNEHTGESYPSEPIELIVGFSVGGGTDTMARMIQPYLQENLVYLLQ